MTSPGVRLLRSIGPILLAMAAPRAATLQPSQPLVPVGAIYDVAEGAGVRQQDLEEMQRLRFTVVLRRDKTAGRTPEPPLWVDRLLAGETPERAAIRDGAAAARVDVGAGRPAAQLTGDAWLALARGARILLFDDWARLRADPAALRDAGELAGHLDRNAALYEPLRPRGGGTDVRVEGAGEGIEAAFLESPAAIVLIAVNRGAERREAVLAFAPEIPEAIWQNMLTGGAVNFVAGPGGPTYAHTFGPHGVLVLMIQKKWR